jgi:hypothetical protein
MDPASVADTPIMRPLRSTVLPPWLSAPALALAAVLALASAPPAAQAAAEAVFARGESLMNVSTDPDRGTSLAITARRWQDDLNHDYYDLFASPLNAAGQPRGTSRPIGGAMVADWGMSSPPHVVAAADTRRNRHLVAWAAHKPGMAREPCAPAAPPLPPVFVFPSDPQCARKDTEIFVRVVDRNGAARGPERQVTSIGPPTEAEFSSAGATLAYDERSDSALLVFGAHATGDEFRAALFAQRLAADGAPMGPVRRLALQPAPQSLVPLLARLVADPRGGFLLAYTWGGPRDGRLYTRRLRADGRPSGGTTALTGEGVGDFRLTFDRRRRHALVLYSSSIPGADNDLRARLLRADGRPVGGPIDLPYPLGRGLPFAASDPDGGGWTYGFLREVRKADNLPGNHHLFVQRAGPSGAPSGPEQLVSQPEHEAYEPVVAGLAGGTALAVWGEDECPAGTPCLSGAPSSTRG